MISVTPQHTLAMTATNRLLCQAALARGWKIDVPYENSSHFYVDRGNGKKLHIFSSSPATLSFAAAHLSNNKYASSRVLDAAGIFQLESYLISDDIDDGARKFVVENSPVVVKPLDGSHGNGITMNVDSADDFFESAVAMARQNSGSGKVLLQRQLVGNLMDIRIVIINGRYIGAVHRIPARVFGDGISTVEELIAKENQQSYRGKKYTNKLALIDPKAADVYLGEAKYRVPKINEEVTVLGVANYGAGGELDDVTDEIPKWMREEAIRIADLLELPVAGIDYMTHALAMDIGENDRNRPVVIEVNKSPSLCMHDEPTRGVNRGAVQAYIEYLAAL